VLTLAVLFGRFWRPQRNDFSASATPHDGRDLFRGAVRDGAERIVLQMGVALGGSGLTMAEHLADEVKAVTAGNGDRGETVPKVMNADIVEPGLPPVALPGLLNAEENDRRKLRRAERTSCLPGAATGPGREWMP
jgi:hypothetical protein